MPEVLTFVDYARRRGGLGLGHYNTEWMHYQSININLLVALSKFALFGWLLVFGRIVPFRLPCWFVSRTLPIKL